MSNPWFQFKQFRIQHDRCGMKVGTDGVLLGAWAPLTDGQRILDVGTGCGLIALMLAQRFPTSSITGIDIDQDAIDQAQENVDASPFAQRVRLEHSPLQDFSTGKARFDAVVCNPPFFVDALLSPDAQRTAARHTASLPFEELIAHTERLLSTNGQFCAILPTPAFDEFHNRCFAHGLILEHSCWVKTSARKAPKRMMVCYRKGEVEHRDEQQLLLTENGQRSEAYASLTRDFYLTDGRSEGL